MRGTQQDPWQCRGGLCHSLEAALQPCTTLKRSVGTQPAWLKQPEASPVEKKGMSRKWRLRTSVPHVRPAAGRGREAAVSGQARVGGVAG